MLSFSKCLNLVMKDLFLKILSIAIIFWCHKTVLFFVCLLLLGLSCFVFLLLGGFCVCVCVEGLVCFLNVYFILTDCFFL